MLWRAPDWCLFRARSEFFGPGRRHEPHVAATTNQKLRNTYVVYRYMCVRSCDGVTGARACDHRVKNETITFAIIVTNAYILVCSSKNVGFSQSICVQPCVRLEFTNAHTYIVYIQSCRVYFCRMTRHQQCLAHMCMHFYFLCRCTVYTAANSIMN